MSTAEAHYPDAHGIFGFRLKPLAEVKNDCLVVLDTNVLLVPYTINPKGLGEVRLTYQKLVTEKRLKIPAQVAREFAKNRAQKMTELHKQLLSKRSKIQGYQQGRYPLLEELDAYQEVVRLEKELDTHVNSYRKALDKVVEHVTNWTWNDPVSLLYGELFNQTTIATPSISADDLQSDIKRRLEHKIPPGYKDGGKDDEGAGDILIWHTILELGKTFDSDVIFVSADAKADWFHKSDGLALYPRFELVDEFRRNTQGRSFHMLKLSDFLGLFEVGSNVIDEVREQEERLQSSAPNQSAQKHNVRKILSSWLSGLNENFLIISDDDTEIDIEMLDTDGNICAGFIATIDNDSWEPTIHAAAKRAHEILSVTGFSAFVCLVCTGRITTGKARLALDTLVSNYGIGGFVGSIMADGSFFCTFSKGPLPSGFK